MKTCLHLSFKALIELIHRLKLSTNKCSYQCETNMVTPTMMEQEHIQIINNQKESIHHLSKISSNISLKLMPNTMFGINLRPNSIKCHKACLALNNGRSIIEVKFV